MGYPTKVQHIKREHTEQWYLTIPAVIAHMMDFSQGEVIEWSVEDRQTFVLHRAKVPISPLKALSTKKKRHFRSSKS